MVSWYAKAMDARSGRPLVCNIYTRTMKNSKETKAHPVIMLWVSTSSSACLWGFNANFMRNSPKSSLAMDGLLVCENDGWMAHLGVLWYAKTMRRVCEWYAKILDYWILIQFLLEAHQNSLWKPRSHPRLPSCFKLNPNTNSRDFPLWPWMAHLVVRWCAKTMRVLWENEYNSKKKKIGPGMAHPVVLWCAKTMRMRKLWKKSRETKTRQVIILRLSTSSNSCLWGFNASFIRNSAKSFLAMDGFLVCDNDGWWMMPHVHVIWCAKTMRMVCEWYAKILEHWI